MRYFVIMGNTRVGSTWFSAAMNSLPGVFCTREIRWRMPYMDQAPPVHTYIEGKTRSIKERLDYGYRASGGKREAVAIGAKLKFDPFGYTAPSAYVDLGKIIEHDVYVAFLRRSYFEIFATWKAFGIRHLANPNARKKRKANDRTAESKQRVSRFHSMHSRPLEQRRVCLTSDGGVIVRFLQNRVSGGKTLYYSISDAIDDLLVLFYNDLLGLTTIQGHRQVDIFGYDDIRTKFFPVTQKLGLAVTEAECLDMLDNASTRQIEPPGAKLVFPDTGLKAVADYLDLVFNQIRTGELDAAEVIHVDESDGSIVFHLPGLAAILERHDEMRELLSTRPSAISSLRKFLSPTGRVEGRYPRSRRIILSMFADVRLRNGYWLAQRPMYIPMPVAPMPAEVSSVNRAG
ncbi:MAG: hypothetical protein FJX44_00120 [Alphaproteobacteria bacterium]|nr:hypothetical protein [Alphaproteobacteria bacterium]